MSDLDELERLAKAAEAEKESERERVAGLDPEVYFEDYTARSEYRLALSPATVLDLIAKARLGEAWARAEAALPYKRWTVTLEGDWENGWVASATSRPFAGLGIEVTTVPVVWGYDRVGAPTPEAALDALTAKLSE